MTGILAAFAGFGSAALDTQTVTSGSLSGGSNPYYTYYGYSDGTGTAGSFGSIADGTSDIYSGAAIKGLYFYELGYSSPPTGYTTRQVRLVIAGNQANSGWSSIKIGDTTYSRASASYSASTNTTWIWNLSIPDPFTSGSPGPFSATTEVEFT